MKGGVYRMLTIKNSLAGDIHNSLKFFELLPVFIPYVKLIIDYL